MRDWGLIYKTILNDEDLTLKDIELISGKGRREAIRIRKEIKEEVIREGSSLPSEQIPVDLLLKHLGKTENYYWRKYKRQLEIKRMEGEINASND